MKMKDEIMVKSGKSAPNNLSLKLKLKNLTNQEETIHEDHYRTESILDPTGMLPENQFVMQSPMDIIPRNHTPVPFRKSGYNQTIDARRIK